MTRNELIASLVPSVVNAWLSHGKTASIGAMIDDAEHIADEMIRREIVVMDDAEPQEALAPISDVDLSIEERGWPAHLIVADRCRFRRNTLVQSGAIAVVVSTVGDFYESHKDINPTTVGSERYYETRAFYAQEDEDGYLDANTAREFALKGETGIAYYSAESDRAANLMHENAVSEVCQRIEQASAAQLNAKMEATS